MRSLTATTLITILCLSFLLFQDETEVLRVSKIKALPAAAANNNRIFIVNDGVTDSDCTTGNGTNAVICKSNGIVWLSSTMGQTTTPTQGQSLPTGVGIYVTSGICPQGFSEDTALVGRAIIGTLAANADVGQTGGNNNITPLGSVSQPLFIGDSISNVLNHVHTVNVNDSGHNHLQNAHNHIVTSQTATTGSATSYEHGVLDTSSAEAEATEVTNSTTATNIANTTGITATTVNPAGGVSSVTPTGIVSQPTFTGTQFDNRSAFIKVIFCKKD